MKIGVTRRSCVSSIKIAPLVSAVHKVTSGTLIMSPLVGVVLCCVLHLHVGSRDARYIASTVWTAFAEVHPAQDAVFMEEMVTTWMAHLLFCLKLYEAYRADILLAVGVERHKF